MKSSIRKLMDYCSHKALSWDEVRSIPRSAIEAVEDELKALPRFATREDTFPVDYFEKGRPQYFVAVISGREFFVDTQGFEYARYAGRL